MILFTISGFFKALIALSVMSNKFGPSAILLDLENREISQLKANQNMYHFLDTSCPYGCTHGTVYHKESLPKDTPISFFKCTEPTSSAFTLLSNDAGDSSEALSSKQTTISLCTNKQLITKARIIQALDVVICKYLFNSTSNKSDE